jgi:AAA+ ATPase superfamily predicted ATPase
MNTSKKAVPATRCWFQERENKHLTFEPDTLNLNSVEIEAKVEHCQLRHEFRNKAVFRP